MEIIPFILAIVLLVPALYLSVALLWVMHAVAALVMNGPRKGVKIIRSW